MKLLLIEDNKSLSQSLKKHLSKTFMVDVAETGDDGIRQAVTGRYDIIILDLNLPDKHGAEVCKTIRLSHINTPILILTGVADIASRVALLNGGADDFVPKPFSIAELRARISALLRRAPSAYNASILAVRDLVIDPGRRQVLRGGIPIYLRRKEFDILEYLVRNRGRAVSRAMILDHAWDTDKDTWHNTVDVHIKHLRDKIDRPFKKDRLIKTAYGIGYMIEDV